MLVCRPNRLNLTFRTFASLYLNLNFGKKEKWLAQAWPGVAECITGNSVVTGVAVGLYGACVAYRST